MSTDKKDNEKEGNSSQEEERFLIDDTNLDDLNDLEKTSIVSPEQTALQAELDKQKQEFLYLRAEFDNFRKQSIKERSDLVKFGAERIARDLLNVIDVMDKAQSIDVTPETLNSYVEGINLTAKELHKTLEAHGIKELDCKGKAFDPLNSEALGQVPHDSVPEGHVLEVMRKGYTYHHKVLRPSQVIIATKPAAAKEDKE